MRRLTRVNPWIEEIDLPRSMLVEWRNLDGEPLQGVLTLPCGYRSGKQYPLIVYIYEKLSDNLHRWRSPQTVLQRAHVGRARGTRCCSPT